MKRNKNLFKNQIVIALSLFFGVLAVFMWPPEPTFAATPGCYTSSTGSEQEIFTRYTRVDCSNPDHRVGVTRGNQCYLIVSGVGTSTAVGNTINCNSFEATGSSPRSSSNPAADLTTSDLCPNPGTSTYASCIADAERSLDSCDALGPGTTTWQSCRDEIINDFSSPTTPPTGSSGGTGAGDTEETAEVIPEDNSIPDFAPGEGTHQCGSNGVLGTGEEEREGEVYVSFSIGCKGAQLDRAGESINAVVDMLFAFFRFFSAGVGIVVVGSIIVAGIQYSSSRGNPQATQAAITRVTSSVVALLVYIFMFAFANYLVPGGLFVG